MPAVSLAPFHPFSPLPPTDRPWGINYGGGANSAALIVECFNRGHRPDWILFCDTGSEKPETYAAVNEMALWCVRREFTEVSVTRWWRQRQVSGLRDSTAGRELVHLERWNPGGAFETLEDLCLRTSFMPSAAYGYAGCSSKAKRQPAERWREANGFERTVYAIGYDAGETKRVNKRKCDRTELLTEEPWYPLFTWGIDRAGCEQKIAEAGLSPVPKSSCFFCPYTKAPEWYRLRVEHPELFERALKIEALAEAAGNARESGLRRSSGYLRSLPVVDADDDRAAPCDCYEASS